MLNIFKTHKTKPPLLITGPAGSGKTRLAKGVKEILGIRSSNMLDYSVQQIEDGDKGLDAFWATVHTGRLEVFDNFDTKIKWASDTLQTAATDGQTKRRELYKTAQVAILKANASVILTSNNPIWSAEGGGGLADRLIIIDLGTNRAVSKDAELSEEIAANRSQYMTWIARTLAKALADKGKVESKINERHPDFGEFSIRIGRVLGCEGEVVTALTAAERDKVMLPITKSNAIVLKTAVDFLLSKNGVWKGKAAELTKLLIEHLGEEADENAPKVFTSKAVGNCISRSHTAIFSKLFAFSVRKDRTGVTVYDFTGTKMQGFEANTGFQTPILEKSMRENAHKSFPKSGVETLQTGGNPASPPNIPSFNGGKEEKEREEEGDIYDGSDF